MSQEHAFNEYHFNDSSRQLQSFITIPITVLQFIAYQAWKYLFLETGGELYGLFSHAGRPVIMLATPPGPNAIHERAHFCQDIVYLKKYNAWLLKQFGIQYIGNWHSHHSLGLEGLSSCDIRSSHAIARSNNYHKMCQLVLTFKTDPPIGAVSVYEAIGQNQIDSHPRDSFSKYHLSSTRLSSNRFIMIHSFHYENPKTSAPKICPIKVLPGPSPIMSLFTKKLKKERLIKNYSFPLTRILISPYVSECTPDKDVPEVPNQLQNQISFLPEEVKNNTRIHIHDDLIILILPITKIGGEINIVYNKFNLSKAEALYFVNNHDNCDPHNLTDDVFKVHTPTWLPDMYSKAVLIITNKYYSKKSVHFEYLRNVGYSSDSNLSVDAKNKHLKEHNNKEVPYDDEDTRTSSD